MEKEMELNNEKRASHKERGPGLKDAGNVDGLKREKAEVFASVPGLYQRGIVVEE